MNRRIRKKKLDAMDRLLANALRLYADRPYRRRPDDPYEELARGLLSMSIGLALRERLQQLPGPRHGCELDPPRGLDVDMPDRHTIHVSGLVLVRDRRGEDELATEQFRLPASNQSGAWKMTRVMTIPIDRTLWEAAV